MYVEQQLIRPEDLYTPEVMYTPYDYSRESMYPVYSQDQVQYTPARRYTTKTKKKKRIGKISPLLLQKAGFFFVFNFLLLARADSKKLKYQKSYLQAVTY